MIQELLGGGNVGLIAGERSNISSPNGGFLVGPVSPSPSSTPSPSSSAGAATAAAAAMENLRCPRCDSSNTKFCYYNNYNLTQPRHFCKTCRRYWTKGGALRNVPIGGGCRKNKSTSIAAAVGKSSTAGKLKTFSSEMGKAAFFSGFEHADAFTQSPILWATPQNSHILSLLRANQNPNPNPLSNPGKEEVGLFGSHLVTDCSISNGGFHSRALGFDPLGPIQVPSIGLSNSFHRDNQHQAQASQAFILGEVQNNGIQDLYQKLRSSTNIYPEIAPQVILGSMVSSSSSSSTIFESAPIAGAEIGFCNSTIYWPTDLPTTNGAYP
ncbi:uncharacterized protein LOC142544793 [Primulina tabacum]|uniref:uncharacterized protein LOC142544793 n=1 Tax=Primulina tabacum TaxID=48773 RepID=UPI003F597970